MMRLSFAHSQNNALSFCANAAFMRFLFAQSDMSALSGMRFLECAFRNALSGMRFLECAFWNALSEMRFLECAF